MWDIDVVVCVVVVVVGWGGIGKRSDGGAAARAGDVFADVLRLLLVH